MLLAASLAAFSCDGAGSGREAGNAQAAVSADTLFQQQRLRDEAASIVAFLRGAAQLEPTLLADSVTLYIAPDGGGEQKRAARQELEDPAAWRVGTHTLVPPADLTDLTTRVGGHFNCVETSLDSLYAELAQSPHVATRLARPDPESCLQTWNMTFVFNDDRARPLLTAVVYDQWEW